MSDVTSTQPEPQATAWMRDVLNDRPFVDPIEICDYYRESHPDTDLSNRVLTESYVAARVPHDDAACTGDEGCECPCAACGEATTVSPPPVDRAPPTHRPRMEGDPMSTQPRETLEYVCPRNGCGWVIRDGPEWGVPACPSHGDPMTPLADVTR